MDKASLEQKTKYAEYIKYNIKEYYKVLATGRMLRQDGTVEQIFMGTQRYKEILETISYLETERENVEKEIQEAGLKPYVFGQIKPAEPQEPQVEVNLSDEEKARIYQELRIITKIKDNLIPKNYKEVKDKLSEDDKDKYRKIGLATAKAKFDLLNSIKDQINLTKEQREALEKGDEHFFEKFSVKDAKALLLANNIEQVKIDELDEDVRLQYVSDILGSVHKKLEYLNELDKVAKTSILDTEDKELEEYDKDMKKQVKNCKNELQSSLDYKKIQSLKALGVDISKLKLDCDLVNLTPTNERKTGSFGKEDNTIHVERDIDKINLKPAYDSKITAVKEVNQMLAEEDSVDVDKVLSLLEDKLASDIDLLSKYDDETNSIVENAEYFMETFGHLLKSDSQLSRYTKKEFRAYKKEVRQASKELGITKKEFTERLMRANNMVETYDAMWEQLEVVSGLKDAQKLIDGIDTPQDLLDTQEKLKETGFTKIVVRDRKDTKYKEYDTKNVIATEPVMVPASALKGLRGYSEVEEKISYKDEDKKEVVEEVTNLEDKNGRKLCKLDIHINEEPIDIDKYVEKINSLNEEKEQKAEEIKIRENNVNRSLDLENEIQGVVAEAAGVDLDKVLGDSEQAIDKPDEEITMDDYEDTATWD